MYGSKTHNFVLLRPPPGARFTLTVGAEGSGSDVGINFERGKEREVYEWIKTWNESYIYPEAERAEARQRQANQDAIDAAKKIPEPTDSTVALIKTLHDDNQ